MQPKPRPAFYLHQVLFLHPSHSDYYRRINDCRHLLGSKYWPIRLSEIKTDGELVRGSSRSRGYLRWFTAWTSQSHSFWQVNYYIQICPAVAGFVNCITSINCTFSTEIGLILSCGQSPMWFGSRLNLSPLSTIFFAVHLWLDFGALISCPV